MQRTVLRMTTDKIGTNVWTSHEEVLNMGFHVDHIEVLHRLILTTRSRVTTMVPMATTTTLVMCVDCCAGIINRHVRKGDWYSTDLYCKEWKGNDMEHTYTYTHIHIYNTITYVWVQRRLIELIFSKRSPFSYTF